MKAFHLQIAIACPKPLPYRVQAVYLLTFIASVSTAMAQPATSSSATAGNAPGIEAMTPAEAEQARLRKLIDAAPPAYEDRFMSADEVSSLRSGEAASAEEALSQPEGLRSWSVEGRLGAAQSSSSGAGKRQATEFGQRIEYRQQTLNYGEWVLQADGRSQHGDQDAGNGIGALGYAREASSQRITLRNLGMPLTPGVLADTTLGDAYSELTTGLSRNYRLTLGTSTVRGLSTRIYGSDFDLRAGMGERGDLLGGPYPGFEKSQGSIAWIGATRRLGDSWYAAGQIEQARSIPASYYNFLTGNGSGSKSVSSWAAAVGYGGELRQDGDLRARLTVLGSSTSSTTPGTTTGGAQGLYLEAGAKLGRFRHEFGAYVSRPNLYFGDYLLPSGTQGAYWRMDHSASRLSWGGGLDFERVRSSSQAMQTGSSRLGASGNMQYFINRDSSIGGNLNLYQTRYDAGASGQTALGTQRSIYAYGFYQTRFFDLPRTRLSLTARRNEQIVLGDGNATGREVQWEQDWITVRRETMRPELTTTLGWADDRSGGTARQYPTAGVQVRYWASSSLSFSGNLRYTSQTGGLYTSRGLSGTLSAEQDLGSGWRLGFSALINQARASTVPLPNWTGPQVYRSNDKTAYVYLRWDGSTGRPFAVAGGAPGTGAGSVSGNVFYDANRDGQRQIGESGVNGVEVVLDGRYRTVTDREGRFSFPMVGQGQHRITVTLDSVPLPWGAADEAGVSVNVPLRGDANAEIPVIKMGE